MKLTPEQRDVVIGRDGAACVACGSRFQEIHHRYRRGMGGSSDPEINSPANLLCLCSFHHAQAESQRTDAASVFGYCVPNLPAAFLTPVRTWQGWQLLTGMGTVLCLGPGYLFCDVEEARTFARLHALLPA
jgi:hypothetical protein